MDAVASVVGRDALPASLGGTLPEAALSPSWWGHLRVLLLGQQQQQQRDGAEVVRGLSTADELGILLQ
jgi:hypothetical protein